MPVKLSTAVRNARLDVIETVVGPSAVLKIRSGSPPVNLAAADSGNALATLALPSDWLAQATSGSKGLAGIWENTSADMSGTAGHWRIYESNGTTAHLQGNITATGGGGDMTMDEPAITAGQQISVSEFSLTDGNG
jgi:hypothetical protein